MAVLIDETIPKQGFEKVRDVIGVILTEELLSQKEKQLLDEDIAVFSERITPMGIEENLFINVLLDSSTYGSITEKDRQGRTIFFIDVYTTGKALVETGTSDSTNRLHKYIGLISYILSHSAYRTLGLQLGLIGGTYIENFEILDPSQKEDTSFTRFARIQFAVRIMENQSLWSGIDLLGNDTNCRLELTEKGYKYTIDNV